MTTTLPAIKAAHAALLEKAAAAGRRAAKDGYASHACPYTLPEARVLWLQGYDSVNIEDHGPWAFRRD